MHFNYNKYNSALQYSKGTFNFFPLQHFCIFNLPRYFLQKKLLSSWYSIVCPVKPNVCFELRIQHSEKKLWIKLISCLFT